MSVATSCLHHRREVCAARKSNLCHTRKYTKMRNCVYLHWIHWIHYAMFQYASYRSGRHVCGYTGCRKSLVVIEIHGGFSFHSGRLVIFVRPDRCYWQSFRPPSLDLVVAVYWNSLALTVRSTFSVRMTILLSNSIIFFFVRFFSVHAIYSRSQIVHTKRRRNDQQKKLSTRRFAQLVLSDVVLVQNISLMYSKKNLSRTARHRWMKF